MVSMRRHAEPTPETAPRAAQVFAGQRKGEHKLWLIDTVRYMDLHKGMSYRGIC